MEFFALVEKILRCPKFHLDNIFIGEKAVSDEVTKFIFKRAFSFSDALCWIEWLMRQGGLSREGFKSS